MSKRHDVAAALHDLIEQALPDADVRGFVDIGERPERIGSGGAVIGYPGDPGVPDIVLGVGPLTYSFEHEFPVEIIPAASESDQTAALDTMLEAIGDAVEADRFLGGLCHFLDVSGAQIEDLIDEGVSDQRFATIAIVASYSTSNPLT